MKYFCLGLLVTFIVNTNTQAKTHQSDKMPMDIRVYMSILAKKGNMLTDYEKNYMESLGHGDIRDQSIDGKTFHDAFMNELENESQAMKAVEAGRQKLEQEKQNFAK